MHAFAEKAMREASDGTSWADPVPAFEQAVHAAVDAAYDRPEVRELIESFARRIDPYGWSNALTQKLVQLTMPGVPDVYQGSELSRGVAGGPGQPAPGGLRPAGDRPRWSRPSRGRTARRSARPRPNCG